jgi:hypothetical protein
VGGAVGERLYRSWVGRNPSRAKDRTVGVNAEWDLGCRLI